MTIVTVNGRIDHPVEKVWPVLADFGGITQLMGGDAPCELVGDGGIGTDRHVTAPNGVVVERLTWLDEATYTFSYTITEGPVPFERYVSTVRLTPDGNVTDVEWVGRCQPTIAEEKVERMLRNLYTSLIDGAQKALD